MNRPDKQGGQNLEQILASIRKTLAEETPAAARPDGETTAHAADPARATESKALGSDDQLPSKLAGALNGAADEDVADLLVRGPANNGSAWSAASASASQVRPQEAKDPLWFLNRAAPGDPPAVDVTKSASAAPAGKAAADDLELTRPDAVRANFPPLFSPPTEAAAGATAGGKASASPPSPTGGADAAPPSARGASPQGGRQDLSGTLPGSTAPAASSVGNKVQGSGSHPEPGGSAKTGGTDPQSKALEQAIAQLLEPLLRKWLESNLPRLVETAIREEVARGLKSDRTRPELKI